MADNDAPKQTKDEDETPTLVVPSHSPLPPPPEVHYVRPDLPRHTSGASGYVKSQPLGNVQEDSAGSQLGSGALKLGSGLAAATTFAASIIAGFLIGQWIDHRWNHTGGLPWGTLVFSLAGVAAGFLNLFRVISATDRSRDKK
ncbi:MAG: AtpZ/AtpI family protein [Janthinobacterium lividum]